jgi:hypothetical protein
MEFDQLRSGVGLAQLSVVGGEELDDMAELVGADAEHRDVAIGMGIELGVQKVDAEQHRAGRVFQQGERCRDRVGLVVVVVEAETRIDVELL